MDMDFCRSVADAELRYKFFDEFFKRQILRNNFFKRTSNYRLLNIHGRIQILYNGIILWQYKNFEKKNIQDSRRVIVYNTRENISGSPTPSHYQALIAIAG